MDRQSRARDMVARRPAAAATGAPSAAAGAPAALSKASQSGAAAAQVSAVRARPSATVACAAAARVRAAAGREKTPAPKNRGRELARRQAERAPEDAQARRARHEGPERAQVGGGEPRHGLGRVRGHLPEELAREAVAPEDRDVEPRLQRVRGVVVPGAEPRSPGTRAHGAVARRGRGVRARRRRGARTARRAQVARRRAQLQATDRQRARVEQQESEHHLVLDGTTGAPALRRGP